MKSKKSNFLIFLAVDKCLQMLPIVTFLDAFFRNGKKQLTLRGCGGPRAIAKLVQFFIDGWQFIRPEHLPSFKAWLSTLECDDTYLEPVQRLLRILYENFGFHEDILVERFFDEQNGFTRRSSRSMPILLTPLSCIGGNLDGLRNLTAVNALAYIINRYPVDYDGAVVMYRLHFEARVNYAQYMTVCNFLFANKAAELKDLPLPDLICYYNDYLHSTGNTHMIDIRHYVYLGIDIPRDYVPFDMSPDELRSIVDRVDYKKQMDLIADLFEQAMPLSEIMVRYGLVTAATMRFQDCFAITQTAPKNLMEYLCMRLQVPLAQPLRWPYCRFRPIPDDLYSLEDVLWFYHLLVAYHHQLYKCGRRKRNVFFKVASVTPAPVLAKLAQCWGHLNNVSFYPTAEKHRQFMAKYGQLCFFFWTKKLIFHRTNYAFNHDSRTRTSFSCT